MIRRIVLITLLLAMPQAHGMLGAFKKPSVQECKSHVLSQLMIKEIQRKRIAFESRIANSPTYLAMRWQELDYRYGETPLMLRFEAKILDTINYLKNINMRILKIFGMAGIAHTEEFITLPEKLQINLRLNPADTHMGTQMILNEAQYPDYQSFAHGANGNLVILFELQKKLYALYHGHGKIPTDFEFLRAREGRRRLVDIHSVDYIKKAGSISDETEPYRTDLLSVGYVAWNIPISLYRRNSSFSPIYLQQWGHEVLAAYDLPMPIDVKFPKINHGVLLQILIKKPVADRLVYNSRYFGIPGIHIELSDQQSSERFYGEARIILDPIVFDHPNDNVKIFRYQQLSEQEKKEIDDFCNRLIADAEKLKAEQLQAEQL